MQGMVACPYREALLQSMDADFWDQANGLAKGSSMTKRAKPRPTTTSSWDIHLAASFPAKWIGTVMRPTRRKRLSTFSASRFSREQRRALETLTRAPRGLTEHFLLARGFSAEMLSSLVLAKLATVVTEYRGATFTVERIYITDVGRMSLQG
jgi:hypothetical protein